MTSTPPRAPCNDPPTSAWPALATTSKPTNACSRTHQPTSELYLAPRWAPPSSAGWSCSCPPSSEQRSPQGPGPGRPWPGPSRRCYRRGDRAWPPAINPTCSATPPTGVNNADESGCAICKESPELPTVASGSTYSPKSPRCRPRGNWHHSSFPVHPARQLRQPMRKSTATSMEAPKSCWRPTYSPPRARTGTCCMWPSGSAVTKTPPPS